MRDLTSPRLIYLKGFLFLLTGCFAAALLLALTQSWQVAALLAISIWSFCRCYYFAFYVIQHYVDSEFRFAGLLDFCKYLFSHRGSKD